MYKRQEEVKPRLPNESRSATDAHKWTQMNAPTVQLVKQNHEKQNHELHELQNHELHELTRKNSFVLLSAFAPLWLLTSVVQLKPLMHTNERRWMHQLYNL